MKPYYEQDGITIYHGDCREVLPGITADVLITDPPYGVGLTAIDRVAEGWLTARHSADWYIGDASQAEWDAADVAQAADG